MPFKRKTPKAILDGNYFLNRIIAISIKNNKPPVDVINGFLRSLWKLKEKGEFINVFDGGTSAERLRILPTYKKKVGEPSPDQVETKKRLMFASGVLEQLLPVMGIPTIRMKGEEADDIIFRLTEHLRSENENVIVLSDDKDYFQILNIPGVKLYRPMLEERYTAITFKTKYGYDLEHYTFALAMIGTHNGVPGIERVGDKTAAKIINEIDPVDIDALEKWSKKADKPKFRLNIRNGIDIIKRNFQLADLRFAPLSKEDVVDMYNHTERRTGVNIEEIKRVCRKYKIQAGKWIDELTRRWNEERMR